ncbi:MAG: Uma2 family endonuclease [Gammaproteobacteria bacterium]|nr:Uma2 family endonuclease [Gammaproteobacteria bacterium]
MSVVDPNVRFTYEDYQSLPESMDKRYELLGGDLIVVPAPTTTHQRAARDIGFLLIQFVRQCRLGEVLLAPVDVVFGKGKNREVRANTGSSILKNSSWNSMYPGREGSA